MPTIGKENKKKNHSSAPDLYQALLNHYLHQDRLMWSRVQLLIAVQGAILVASYYISQIDDRLAAAIMFLAVILTVAILWLVILDIAGRDRNLPLMDELVKSLLPEKIDEDEIIMKLQQRRKSLLGMLVVGYLPNKLRTKLESIWDITKDWICKVAKNLLPDTVKKEVENRKTIRSLVRLTAETPWFRHFISGGLTLKLVLVLFILLDITLGIQYLAHQYEWPMLFLPLPETTPLTAYRFVY